MILTAPPPPSHAYGLLTKLLIPCWYGRGVKSGLVIVVLAAAVAALASTASGAGPFRTAVVADGDSFNQASLAFARVRDAGATVVRINLIWDQVAPNGRKEPA